MERGALQPISGSAHTQRPWLPGPRWFRKLVVSVGCYIVISWARQLELELQNRSQQRRTGLIRSQAQPSNSEDPVKQTNIYLD